MGVFCPVAQCSIERCCWFLWPFAGWSVPVFVFKRALGPRLPALLLRPLLTSVLLSQDRPPPGKGLNCPRVPSNSTCSVLMRIGLRACQRTCRPLPASLLVRVPMVAVLPAASFRPSERFLVINSSPKALGAAWDGACGPVLSVFPQHPIRPPRSTPFKSPSASRKYGASKGALPTRRVDFANARSWPH
jgi:hypothetical protein